jgi:hypothetical protein
MSLFFYRAWAGVEHRGPGAVSSILRPGDPLYYTRWGYAALLGITLVAGVVMNTVYLLGYWVCPRAMLEVPHVALVSLAIRDLLICLFVMPAALDWLVAGLTSWPGGELWCKTAVFFDYYLNTVYPLLVLMLCVILYTRKLPPKPPTSRESVRQHHASSRMSHRSGYVHHNQAPSVRPPSVASSVQSGRHEGFRKGFSKAPSVGGSQRGPGSISGSVSGRHPHSRYGQGPDTPGPRSSSPLGLVQEECDAGSIDGELWELASMEYPGKNDLDLEFEEEGDEDEPRLREWLKYIVHLVWVVGLGIGAPAAMLAQSDHKPPGCYLVQDHVLIAKSRFSYILQDPTMNLLISSVSITYIAASVLMIMAAILLCTTRWTQDGKLNRFYKMCIALSVLFIVSRSPIDILQFTDIVYTAKGSTITNRRPDQLEHEILLVWAALVPVVGNPIIYLFCVTEYRQNISRMWKACTGPKEVSEDDEFHDIPDDRSVITSTKQSEVL